LKFNELSKKKIKKEQIQPTGSDGLAADLLLAHWRKKVSKHRPSTMYFREAV
jgi:hypothetical protein